jgi:hypothetical protein
MPEGVDSKKFLGVSGTGLTVESGDPHPTMTTTTTVGRWNVAVG